jgi:hypothetical protein
MFTVLFAGCSHESVSPRIVEEGRVMNWNIDPRDLCSVHTYRADYADVANCGHMVKRGDLIGIIRRPDGKTWIDCEHCHRRWKEENTTATAQAELELVEA